VSHYPEFTRSELAKIWLTALAFLALIGSLYLCEEHQKAKSQIEWLARRHR